MLQVSSDIAEQFGVSILISPELQSKEISGSINDVQLPQALDILEFLSGASVTPGGEGLYYIGGARVTSLHSFPSYGLEASEIQGVYEDRLTLVRDQFITETSQGRAKQLGDLLEGVSQRERILLELYILDVSDTNFDRVNEWLSLVEMGADLEISDVGSFVTTGYSGKLELFGEMIENGSETKVLLRQTVEMVSGSPVTVESTDIVERPVFLRQNETNNDLVTQFNQRRIGLIVELLPAVFEGTKWHLDYMISDSTLEGTIERKTQIEGQRVFDTAQTWGVIATLQRQQKTKRATSFLGLNTSWLTKERTEWQKRNLVMMLRTVQPVGGAQTVRSLEELE